nr:thio(seleno)oxazole modification radical SAM maturase SbtM [uncultured Desulfobacter sp.]
MNSFNPINYHTIYPNCRRILGDSTWGRILKALDNDFDPAFFSEKLSLIKQSMHLPGFIDDLARIEWTMYGLGQINDPLKPDIDGLSLNPWLTLLPVSYGHLAQIVTAKENPEENPPLRVPDNVHVMVWRHPQTGEIHVREAEDADLLALKIVAENIDFHAAAAEGGVTIGVIDAVVNQAACQGLVLKPKSLIIRSFGDAHPVVPDLKKFVSANAFTLQWHITQACDLHCKHCYDRRDRDPLPFDTALAILDDFYDFCHAMHVKGNVTFTGGNPLLYPNFTDIYAEAANRGFGLAVLGNPSAMSQIEEIVNIQMPGHFQISLEGLEAHNDRIRGKGHLKRSLAFLDMLGELNVYRMVMLTLTRDNIDQVLPLAELLADRVDLFTFNRLAAVGEGEKLLMAEPEQFRLFLEAYSARFHESSILGLKDNLFNILLQQEKSDLFGGCTGYGCGAAFNFVALLSDGEVHACRKFPSLIGNILNTRLIDIYHSELAQKYRSASSACRECSLNLACRGCLAVTYSQGLDIFKDKDPFCFMPPVPENA